VLREIFLTDDPLDLDKIAQLTTDFPGITHCLIIMRTPDGQQLAGALPSDLDRRQFTNSALQFAEKTSSTTKQLGIGKSSVFTLYCEAGIISFFTGDQICVSVKHHQRGFLPGVREKLQRVTEELGNILLTSTSN
jgi:predicted regulator of Ras-like GTPase activity (Roadblock/LC7/MglB family)